MRKSDGLEDLPDLMVASCNGCKSFFRRAIILAIRYECSKKDCLDSSCPIDSTRLCCRGCRFQKCVEVGMNPLGIKFKFSEASKVFIDEIRKEQEKGRPVLTVSNPQFSNLSFTDDTVNQLVSKLSTVESVSFKIHDSGLPDGYCDFRSLEEILASHLVKVNSDIPSLQSVTTDNNRYPPQLLYTHCSFLEYSKTFDFYSKISFSDKLKLAHHVVAGCSTLHDAFFSINQMKSDCLRFPNGAIIGEKSEEDMKKVLFFEITFLAMFRTKLDRVEYMLLKALVLCNPVVSNLSLHAQGLLETERRQYGFCLLRYCRLQYGALHGASRYAELLSIVPVLENQMKTLKDFYTMICLPRLLQELEDLSGHPNPVQTFTTDRCTNLAQVMKNYPTIAHHYDAWHWIRSVRKDIGEKSNQKQFEPLKPWVQRFINHIHTAIRMSNGDGALAYQSIISFFYHVQGIHGNFQAINGTQFTKVQSCMHSASMTATHNDYLDLQEKTHKKAFEVMYSIMTKQNRERDLLSVSPHFSTSSLESFHSLANYYLPKGNFFDESGYKLRSKTAILHWNALQLAEASGDRIVQYLISYYCKTKKMIVWKPRKTEAENLWRFDVFEKAKELVLHGKFIEPENIVDEEIEARAATENAMYAFPGSSRQ